MKLLFFSDLHAHNWSQFATRLPNGRNSRLQDCINIIAQATDLVQKREVDYVFFLGDLFHSRAKIDVDVAHAVWSEIALLSEAVGKDRLYLLRGNHDTHARIGDVHSLHSLAAFAEIIDSPRQISIPVSGSRNLTIYAHPWTAEVDNIKHWFGQIATADFVLLHQAMREGQVGPYSATVDAALSVLDLPLDRVRYVLAGDYHKRQWFGEAARVHYVGSPLQLDFGERGEDKSFTLYDSESDKFESIPTDAPRFFQFNGLIEVREALESGTFREGIDFVRIKYNPLEQELAEKFQAEHSTVRIQKEDPELQVLAKTSEEVLHSDVLLLDEYVRMSPPAGVEEERLVQDYFVWGCELLMGDPDANSYD